jgi:hypothetical protein
MAPPPTARRRCDRPVTAGRSTALKGSAGATSARARPADRYQDNPSQERQPIREPDRNPSEADSTPLPTTRWRIVTDHPSLHHSLRSAGPISLPPHTPCRIGATEGRIGRVGLRMQISQFGRRLAPLPWGVVGAEPGLVAGRSCGCGSGLMPGAAGRCHRSGRAGRVPGLVPAAPACARSSWRFGAGRQGAWPGRLSWPGSRPRWRKAQPRRPRPACWARSGAGWPAPGSGRWPGSSG